MLKVAPILFVLLAVLPLRAEAPLDWAQAVRTIQKVPRAQARQLANQDPTSGQELLVHLAVFTRLGMDGPALSRVKQLKARHSELDPGLIREIMVAAEEGQTWEAAKALVEAYAPCITNLPRLNEPLINHLLASGWHADQVDGWLKSLSPKQEIPSPRHGLVPSPTEFWFKVRLHFNLQHARMKSYLQELEVEARAMPSVIPRTLRLLEALRRSQIKMDLAWIPRLITPTLATEAWDLGGGLQNLSQWALARDCYRRALARPLTSQEIRDMAASMARLMPSDEPFRASFSARTLEALATCALKLDQPQEAQALMLQAEEMRKQHGFDSNVLLAGQVQAASGQRVMEKRVENTTAKQPDEVEVWLKQAQYFEGRGDKVQEEGALKRALTLSEHQPNWRVQTLNAYARFLMRQGRSAEIVPLLRSELTLRPHSKVAEHAVRTLAYDHARELQAEDELLWGWLTQRLQWGFQEERLLWEMLQNASNPRFQACLTRAEKLGEGAHPSRKVHVAWVFTRLSLHARDLPKDALLRRAIPMLEEALKQPLDRDLLRNAQVTLYEAYLDLGDWKQAEPLIAAVKTEPENDLRLALVAARAQAKGDAIRFWFARAERTPADLSGLEELASLGLQTELTAYYRDLQKQLPQSGIPERALKILAKSTPPFAK